MQSIEELGIKYIQVQLHQITIKIKLQKKLERIIFFK